MDQAWDDRGRAATTARCSGIRLAVWRQRLGRFRSWRGRAAAPLGETWGILRGAARLCRWNALVGFGSDVVVQLELVRVRAQLHRRDLVGALVVDPGLDQVGGED